MRFLLTLLFSAGLVTSALAENWTIVDDGANGERMLLDVDSKQYGFYKNDKENMFVTMLGKLSSEEIVHVVRIDVKECLTQQKGNLLIVPPETKNSQNFFWSMEGNKIYDAMGTFICQIVYQDYKNFENNK